MSDPLTSFIAGRALPASGPVVARENPGRTSETAVRWCAASPADASAAIGAAATAFPALASCPLEERIGLLAEFLDELERDADALAAIIVRENGKPRRDALAEVRSALADARHPLTEAARDGLVEHVPEGRAGVQRMVVLEPLGPCLVVTPWNFPLATVLRKLVPALVHGNPVVVKPSEFTPESAAALVTRLAPRLPASAVSLVLGSGTAIGPALLAHPALRAVSFTGSTATGLGLARAAAGRDVRLQLELGGKNPLVVLADADLDAALEAAVTAGFGCSGQWCTGTGRVIVDSSLAEEFTVQLAARANTLRVGPGDEESSDLGPLITAARVHFATETVDAAVGAGARLVTGGEKRPGGHFLTPAVLAGVTGTMPAATDELFVPVLPVLAAVDEDDALHLANLGDRGLSASVFSRDVARATIFARRIEAGIVHINLHTAYREPALPVPGWRESGRGLPECGRYARDFHTRPRAVYLRAP